MNNVCKANDFVRQVQNSVLDISLPGWFILLLIAHACAENCLGIFFIIPEKAESFILVALVE